MKILLMSNMDSQRPYGNFTRPYYLGMELSRFAEVYQLGFNCEGIKYGRSRSIGSYSVMRCMAALAAAIKEFKPDIVYSQENRPNLCAYMVSRAGQRTRNVFDFHASPAFEYRERGQRMHSLAARLIETRVLRRGSRIILASDYLRGLLKENYGLDAPERIEVIPNGVPNRMLEQAKSSRSPYDFAPGTKIAFAIIPRNFESNIKAAEFTLDVARKLEKETWLKFVIVGGGPTMPAPSNVTFTGHVEDVIPYIDWSDLCLSPYPAEAHCGAARNKLLEFFARRKPVVSTLEGMQGIEEAKDGEHMFLGGESTEEFAKSVARLAAGEGNPGSVVDAAFGLVAGKYNWRNSGESLMRILERV